MTLSPAERRLGDLDHPMYGDERTRYLSYEVYSVAYQGLQLGVGCVVAAMAWFGDRAVAAWGLAVFAVLYVALVYTGTRIQRLTGAEVRRENFNARAVLVLGVYFIAFLGLANQLVTDPQITRSLVLGAITGGATSLICAWWKTRQADKNRPNPADIPDED